MKKSELPDQHDVEDLLRRFREVPEREARAAAAGRAEFLAQADRMRTLAHSRPQGLRHQKNGAVFFGFRSAGFQTALNAIVAVVVVLVILFGGTTLTVYAAQSSMPDQALYPIKTLSEDAFLALASGPQQQLDLTLNFTNRRLSELEYLQAAGQNFPQSLVDRYNAELDQALLLSAGLDDAGMTHALVQIGLHAEIQLQALNALVAGHPGAAGLEQVQSRLQEQVQESAQGEQDPQGLRLRLEEQYQDLHAPSGQGQDETPGSHGTPAHDAGTPSGGHQPAATPERTRLDHGNAKPTKTPKSPGHQGQGHP